MARDLAVPDNSAVSITAPLARDGIRPKSILLGKPDPGSSFPTLISQIAEQARILTGADGSAIALRGEEGTICRARSGQAAPALGALVDITSGISKQCLESAMPICCPDIAVDARVDPKIPQAVGTRSIAVVPIYCDGEVFGILEVFSRSPGSFTDQHLRILEKLADLIDEATSTPAVRTRNDPSTSLQLNVSRDVSLLVEQEPAYRIFFGNLAELFSSQPPPPPHRVRGWTNVLIAPHVSWHGFLESIVLHIVVIAMAFGLTRIWPRELTFPRRSARDAHLIYYPAAQSFSARERNPAVSNQKRQISARQDVINVARERAVAARNAGDTQNSHGLVAPPPAVLNSLLGRFKKPSLGLSTPVLPAPSDVGKGTARSTNLPTVSVVAPPPDVGDRSGSRRVAALGAPAIPPPPDVSSGSGSRRVTALGTAAVPPSPEVQGAMGNSGRRTAAGLGINSAGSADRSIVSPPPSMNNQARLTLGSAGGSSHAGVTVVAPPPSLEGRGQLSGRGNSISAGGGGSQVVPPPPSTEGTGRSPGSGWSGAFGSGASQVVPPAPSLQASGNYAGGGRASGLSTPGTQVVPPPPSVQGGGGGSSPMGGRGIAGGLAGSTGASQVVPPAPSLGNGVNGTTTSTGGGKMSSRPGGTDAVLPPSTPAANSSQQDNSVASNEPNGSTDSAPASADQPKPTFQDLALRLISAAWTPPRSSYFSNYEVFIAEKVGNKGGAELIKLVYVFLPYQRRLAEYGFDFSKARKLRVVRDPTCDESLMQMEWPEGENAGQRPGVAANSNAERGSLLPCYRTTADDYRRAFSRGR